MQSATASCTALTEKLRVEEVMASTLVSPWLSTTAAAMLLRRSSFIRSSLPEEVILQSVMASSLKEIDWGDISEAVPAFFASVFMAFSYSISYGIAGGFITYCLIKTCKGKAKEVHPVIWVVSLLFILDFIITAIL